MSGRGGAQATLLTLHPVARSAESWTRCHPACWRGTGTAGARQRPGHGGPEQPWPRLLRFRARAPAGAKERGGVSARVPFAQLAQLQHATCIPSTIIHSAITTTAGRKGAGRRAGRPPHPPPQRPGQMLVVFLPPAPLQRTSWSTPPCLTTTTLTTTTTTVTLLRRVEVTKLAPQAPPHRRRRRRLPQSRCPSAAGPLSAPGLGQAPASPPARPCTRATTPRRALPMPSMPLHGGEPVVLPLPALQATQTRASGPLLCLFPCRCAAVERPAKPLPRAAVPPRRHHPPVATPPPLRRGF